MSNMAAEKLIKATSIINEIYGKDLHKKRQLSIAYTAMGILASESLFLHEIAKSLVKTRGIGKKKHATKQIDRLLSNKGISVWNLAEKWVPYVIGKQSEIIIALDWTTFADDMQLMLSLNILTSKGISTPLLWKTVNKTQLKFNRAHYEDELLSRLKDTLPQGIKVTVVADRGFADKKFFQFLSEELHFNYIIRIKANTTIICDKNKLKASERLLSDRRIFSLKKAKITLEQYEVENFIAVQDKEMKAAWFLVTNTDFPPRKIINLYSKRWKIEPYFRDLKDGRFGYGLIHTHIKSCERRDRLMLVLAISYLLLIILGQAGENIGFDEKLKVNTVKTRTHSLFRQGKFYYEFFNHFTIDEQNMILSEFQKLLEKESFWMNFMQN